MNTKAKLIIAFLLLTKIGTCQQTWVSDNAVWTYRYQGIAEEGYITIKDVENKIINGKPCKGYEQKIFRHAVNQLGELILISTEIIDTTYLHYSNDSVSIFFDNSFTPIYIFSLNNNDSYSSIIENQSNNCSSTSQIVITDSSSINFNNQDYTTFKLTSNDLNSYKINGLVNSRFGHFDTSMEKYNFLFPQLSMCDIGLDESLHFSFQCFEDDDFSFNSSTEECVYPYNTLSLSENLEVDEMLVVNPVVNGILKINTETKLNNLTLMDLKGNVFQLNPDININDISFLTSGLYILVATSEKKIKSQKIVIFN